MRGLLKLNTDRVQGDLTITRHKGGTLRGAALFLCLMHGRRIAVHVYREAAGRTLDAGAFKVYFHVW